MRIIFIIILIVLLVWAIVDPILRLKEKPSGFWLVVLSLLIVFNAGMEVRWLIHQNEATEIVKKISGKEESVAQCQRWSEAFFDAKVSILGFVEWDKRNIAQIKYNTCQDFMGFMESDKRNATEEQIRSVAVISHEAWHVKGINDEGQTECNSQKDLASVFLSLGVSSQKAKEYTIQYAETSKNFLPDHYLNATC